MKRQWRLKDDETVAIEKEKGCEKVVEAATGESSDGRVSARVTDEYYFLVFLRCVPLLLSHFSFLTLFHISLLQSFTLVLALIGDLLPSGPVIKSLVLASHWAHQHFGHLLWRHIRTRPKYPDIDNDDTELENFLTKHITSVRSPQF